MKKTKNEWKTEHDMGRQCFLRSLGGLTPYPFIYLRGRKGRIACNHVSGIWISLHRESRCEMLIEGNDISNDVITLGACFHVFFNICLPSRSFLLRADWRKSDSSVDGEPQGNWRWHSNSRDVVASSPSFSRPAARAPRRACSVYLKPA